MRLKRTLDVRWRDHMDTGGMLVQLAPELIDRHANRLAHLGTGLAGAGRPQNTAERTTQFTQAGRRLLSTKPGQFIGSGQGAERQCRIGLTQPCLQIGAQAFDAGLRQSRSNRI